MESALLLACGELSIIIAGLGTGPFLTFAAK